MLRWEGSLLCLFLCVLSLGSEEEEWGKKALYEKSHERGCKRVSIHNSHVIDSTREEGQKRRIRVGGGACER
jgi:hypothetical protein